MLKREELENPNSCLNRADDGEMVFTLLARDECAPDVIREWVDMRIARGKNQKTDSQILDALKCADIMEEQFYARKEINPASNR